ncbi:HAD-IIA family hydrolase [Hydrogenimonas urashimensis]|uniref:HAD-IIA family hydrolase n=1 Tax=Hydrogenimonas urashimensis TaxID=2740515 RepID=UPI001915FD26|nr:HAD-IIA family hydrolase [Hydrogenimonas urashimensis]
MIDVQGTLIDDREKKPIEGAVDVIRRLQEENVPYVLVTNNTKQESERFQNYLREQGFLFSEGQYLDPLMVLDKVVPPTAVAAYGSSRFLEVLQKRGYALDYESPEAVLVAIKEDFTNEEYAQMIELVLEGARLVGMHETSIYAKHGHRYPGVGAILKMVSFATGKGYEVVGKPSRAFYTEALKRLQAQDASVTFSQTVMISDDLVGDLMEAKTMGMKTVLVLSGKIASVREVEAILEKGADSVAETVSTWFANEKKGAA